MQAVRRDQKLLIGEPPASVDNQILYRPSRVVENHIVNLPEFLVVAAVYRRATNVIRSIEILKAIIAQQAIMGHTSSWQEP
jgi:hypothetical protein